VEGAVDGLTAGDVDNPTDGFEVGDEGNADGR
jgi:hypothetical protein